MMRYVIPYLIYSAVALCGILLQSALFSHLEIFNAKPDLLLLIVLMSGLKSDWKNGIVVGLLIGFWIDLFNAGYFGMNMVVYAVIGAICGLVGMKFPNRTYEGYFFTAVMASLLSGSLTLVLFHLLGAHFPVGQSIAGIIIPMTFYTSLMAFLFLPFVWIYRRLPGRKIGRIDLIGNGVIFVRGNEKVDAKMLEAHRRKQAQKRRASHFHQRNRQKSSSRNGRTSPRTFTRRPSQSGTSPRRKTGSGFQDQWRKTGTGRTSKNAKGKTMDKKPKSRPQKRPQKHSGRRSK